VLAVASWLVVPAAARAASPPRPPAPPAFHGRAAAVIDGDTLQVIWRRNGDQEMPMASLTKIMTALVALRDLHGDLNAQMAVPPQAARIYGERIYLRTGEVYTFGQMLEAMLVQSANDAAVTIAVNAAGSQRAFVGQMNREAAAMGLDHTHFANVHGLDAPYHYSSALDLARLGALAMRDAVFARIAGMQTASIPWPGHGERVLYNHNYLLTGYPGATGVKIGYTSDALNCVVGSAVRDGHEVVAVVMGEARWLEWRDESQLLNYGFAMLPLLPPPAAAPPARGPADSTPRRRAGALPPASPAHARPWASYFGLAALAVVTVLATMRRPR
jgi:D-alanyl-D-alanine carboxypeptidase (penicillin-binding protein 5/6)